MKKCYIHSAVAISAQNTFMQATPLLDIANISGTKRKAVHPNYKSLISPSASRRMATGVKMSMACSTKALKEAKIKHPDAIIIGTGMGCIEDTEKFLNAIIANNEEYLTPTAFIQSTHNTVAGQISLSIGCKGYNNTYSQASSSFESALIDAKLMLGSDEADHILVGGVDELGTEFIDYVGMLEERSEKGINVPFSEGASFFVVSNSQDTHNIQLVDVETWNTVEKAKISSKLNEFLSKNKISKSNIDLLILGYNGDNHDAYYDSVSNEFNPLIPNIHYKQLSGEYFTASGFSVWLGYNILKNRAIPDCFRLNGGSKRKLKTILIYNQFKGKDHGFIILRR